jgi:hypothetical protein
MTCWPISLHRAGRILAAAAVAIVLVVPAAASQTPPLGEVARKEQERRKETPAAGKVYTNKDLPQSAAAPKADGAKPAEPSSAIPTEPGSEPRPAAATPADPSTGAADEAQWKNRINAAREELRRSEMFAEALQTRGRSLSRDSMTRDDPAQRARLRQEHVDVNEEIARVKQEIERGRKQIADIEEEARKAGVPPGWLR